MNRNRIFLTVIPVLVAAVSVAGCNALDDAKSVYRGEAGVDKDKPAGTRARVNAATANAASAIPEGWCEKRWEPGAGPELNLPANTVFNQGQIVGDGRPRWINMWATWCRPCIAEIPHILRWRDARLGNGTIFSLEMLSVDEDLNEFKSFMSRHTELRSTRVMRMSDPTGLGAYASSLGLGQDTTVPIHVFAGSDNRIVCVRAGGITESDLGVIRELLR